MDGAYGAAMQRLHWPLFSGGLERVYRLIPTGFKGDGRWWIGRNDADITAVRYARAGIHAKHNVFPVRAPPGIHLCEARVGDLLMFGVSGQRYRVQMFVVAIHHRSEEHTSELQSLM